MYSGGRAILQANLSGDRGKRISLPACAATLLKYDLSGRFFVAKYPKESSGGLWYGAIFLPEGAAEPPREIVTQPELAVYITDFGQPDDLCLVAESDENLLGAVWTRILAGKVKGYGNVDGHTPEFTISVKKEFRQQGIGSKLMQEMLVLLKRKGYEKVSLSVNKDNYVYRMYQKLDFRVIREQDEDYLMVLKL